MLDLLNALFRLISPLWEMSVTAAYAAAVVIVLRLLLKKRAPKQVLCLLWLVVFARLLIPVSLESPLSIVPDALPGQEYVTEQSPADPGAGDSVTPIMPQNPVQGQIQNQPGNGTAAPVTGNQNTSLSVPEGVGPSIPAPEAPASFPWQAVIAGMWLTGAAAMGGYALVSWLRLRRRLFDAIHAGDGVWEHPAVDSPFILGVLRPRIYLPAGLMGQPRQFILCHERAHLRRLDHIVKPVCWIALALHWFNPLVWAAFLLMSRDIESACDEAVVRQLGSEIKADYSDTLLALATGRRLPAPCPLAFDEGDAKGRIRNVLNYRRPALWAIVISVTVTALAAVCLLTDPVAAKDPGGDPDPDATASLVPDASNSQNVEGLDSLLDPWMKELLDGERTFSSAYDDRAYSINDLKLFLFGDAQAHTTLDFELAILDLDRDGVNEMIFSFTVDNNYLSSDLGDLILRRQGDTVYGYNPNYRGFNQLKADGTFRWSNSAFEGGTATMSFDGHQYDLNYITWSASTDDFQEELYFVDGLKATRSEFEAAIAAQDAKPEPTWYVYKNDVLGTDAEYPLDRNPDLNGNGVPETVQIMELDGGRRLELWESDKLIFTEEGYYAHAGYNSMFLCTLDGKDYLLRYNPNGAQGWCHYSYELFTLTRDGQEKVIQENSVEFDINFGPMHESFDPEALAAFMDEVNDLLANSVQLINTNDELLGTFQKEGRLYDSLSWLDLWAPVYVRNETASLLENLRTFQASMEIAKDYPSVLLGKSKFVLYQDEQTSLFASIDDVPALICENDPSLKIWDFAVVDMDGDGTDEVLVRTCGISVDTSGYLLLREENGAVYGTIFNAHNNWSNRWFGDLKTDGTFECHDVGDRWHSISKLFFTARGGTGIYGLTVLRNDPDYDLESFMTVQKEVTREKDWWAAVDAQKEKPDAVWYEFNEENIIAAFMKG